MQRTLSFVIGLIFLSFLNGFAQEEDPILFTVEDTPVHLSEFEYIYNKNNGKKADYSRASLSEYLDLYKKFKLKVHRAKDLKLDTIPSLQKELEGYRRQLANSYLTDKEVSDRLARELYERMETDINVSHILIALPKNPSPKDIEAAKGKADGMYAILKTGANFEEMAGKHSEDRNSKVKGGEIGFVTAMLPNGFYDLENTIYTLKDGEISAPVRSPLGFHIVRVNERRPARGKIEAAHILIRKGRKGSPDKIAETRIDSIYGMIKNGMSFEKLATTISEDKSSKTKGGNIGVFGINRFEKSFEDAAFALENDGDISEPVETSIGWHIIKLIERRDVGPFERVKRKLQADLVKDERYEIAQGSMIARIKKENSYHEDTNALNRFADGLDDNFLTYKWKIPTNLKKEKLFSLGQQAYHTTDFAKFLRTNSRSRLRMNKNIPVREAVSQLFEEYVRNECIKFEEGNLEEKYPDFKSLMREYEEGILLFEATKLAVWDKASQDTTGLKVFHEANRNKYKWDKRAVIADVTVKGLSEKKAGKIYKALKKKSLSKTLKKYNKKGQYVSFSKKTYERGEDGLVEGMPCTKGFLSPMKYNAAEQTTTFRKIVDILEPAVKEMHEARGYIIADYQDHLEKLWIKELQDDYKVEVNQDVFESMMR